MRYLPYILTGVFMTATLILTIHAHDTNILLDAKDSRIATLNMNLATWKASAHTYSQANQNCRRVVGDYVAITNELKARGNN